MIGPVRFTIPGRLRGKGRPRTAVRGKFATIYTDAKTKSAEAEIRGIAQKAMGGRLRLEGAVSLSIMMHLQRPKGWSKRQRASQPIPVGRPDVDNCSKLLADSLNGVVFKDDAQISLLIVGRMFAQDGEGEWTEVLVDQMTAPMSEAA